MLQQLKNSLLLTDARMIAEDENHVVVSIRVPKQTIADNIPLIRSALDASLDRRFRWRRVIGLLSFLLLHPLAMVINWVLNLYFVTHDLAALFDKCLT